MMSLNFHLKNFPINFRLTYSQNQNRLKIDYLFISNLFRVYKIIVFIFSIFEIIYVNINRVGHNQSVLVECNSRAHTPNKIQKEFFIPYFNWKLIQNNYKFWSQMTFLVEKYQIIYVENTSMKHNLQWNKW